MKNNLLNSAACWISLGLIPGLGNAIFNLLLKRFGSPEKIYEASSCELSNLKRVNSNIQEAISEKKYLDKAIMITNQMLKKGIEFIDINSEDYPEWLKEIHNPPPFLFYKGNIDTLKPPKISIVGSRSTTQFGREIAYKLAKEISAEGFTIVSGMAKGIDRYALLAALENNGSAIAVLGNGVDIIYPPENRDIYNQLEKRGLLISQFLPGFPPSQSTFPIRNRIIAGLSMGVVVVEAGIKSGALITANHAIDEGREVFVIPGYADSITFRGSAKLIESGANQVSSSEEILKELEHITSIPSRERRHDKIVLRNIKETTPPQREIPIILENLNNLQEKIILALDTSLHIDNIVEKTGIDINTLALELLELELKGLIIEQAGKTYRRTSKI
ncbi:MAG: DNA-processing protein DprA [Candidatus Coatesbacteria bacterium]|nr:DNA-processing protein DprA [Candidatus Coatesbacteria bacterium]